MDENVIKIAKALRIVGIVLGGIFTAAVAIAVVFLIIDSFDSLVSVIAFFGVLIFWSYVPLLIYSLLLCAPDLRSMRILPIGLIAFIAFFIVASFILILVNVLSEGFDMLPQALMLILMIDLPASLSLCLIFYLMRFNRASAAIERAKGEA